MPEMSAQKVTDELVEALKSGDYQAIICNYANADMVGHTGNFEATVRCIETLDRCLEQAIVAAQSVGTEVLITADHGNAEKMVASDTDQPHTAHTSNLVPLIYVGRKARLVDNGTLRDIAPTLLKIMGLMVPPEMTGNPLIDWADTSQDAA